MKRNTITKLGMLRIGDRFYFTTDKQPQIREVTMHIRDAVKYNKISPRTFKPTWFWDRSQPVDREVMFIRHTNLLPGDECFMHELKDGDVFTKPGDKSKREMRRVKEVGGQIVVRYVGNAVWLHTSPLTTGIFVRRASLKTKPDEKADL